MSLVIKNFSTQMYFEITNIAPRRLIMYKTDSFISADEIKEIVGISKSKAYSLIQELNSELKEKGYLTVTGRVSRKYFEERFYGLVEKE